MKPVTTPGRYELSVTDNNTFTAGRQAGQRSTSRGLTLSSSYNFRSPTGFKIPILGRIKFQSVLSLSLDFSHRLSKSERIEYDGSLTPTSESSDLSISPRASYSFSTNIKGGMSMRWTDREDKRTHKKSHVRQVGIWVEIKF
jgi:hypothetical protein